MMRNPDRWPVWPYLPLKRQALKQFDSPEVGFLTNNTLDGQQEDTTIYLGTFFARPPLDQMATLRYSTWDELLDDGWYVD